MNVEAIQDQIERTAEAMWLRAVTLGDFLIMKLPERKLLLAPWLSSSGLAMIYAPRGIGKTWLAMAVSSVCATGGELMGCYADKPWCALYLDREMRGQAMQERFASVVSGTNRNVPPDALHFLTLDLHNRQKGAA